jgi:hypothetical protein
MTISIVTTYLKAHRTGSSLRVKKGAWTSDRADQRRCNWEWRLDWPQRKKSYQA